MQSTNSIVYIHMGERKEECFTIQAETRWVNWYFTKKLRGLKYFTGK